MDNFIKGRKKEIEVLKYVIQEEDNNSDEEYNQLDYIANNYKEYVENKMSPIGKINKLERALL